jgi:phytoene synthase
VTSAASLGDASLAADELLARARGENFSVAPRWLPSRRREDLLAIYGFARLVDEIGDLEPAERAPLLDEVAADLERAFRGEPRHPLLRRLAPTLRRRALPRTPFERLIEANRCEGALQLASWPELLRYCALSANPVGELVLRIFGQADAERLALSDSVCSALQVIEHCQDVAEDSGRGRVYLPAEDLAAHGCEISQLASAPAPAELRAVVALEIGRARELLRAAPALVRSLRGFARVAVAGFAAGGLAACDALQAAGYDPSAGARGTRWRRARHAAALLLAGARA